jgi:hypothetical protein
LAAHLLARRKQIIRTILFSIFQDIHSGCCTRSALGRTRICGLLTVTKIQNIPSKAPRVNVRSCLVRILQRTEA